MRTVNIHAAKTQLLRLVEAAGSGEEIIITKKGQAGCAPVSARPAAA